MLSRVFNKQSFPVKPRMLFAHSCIDDIAVSVRTNHKEWLRKATNVEPLSLANSIVMCSRMLAHYFSLARNQRPRGSGLRQPLLIRCVHKNVCIGRNVNYFSFSGDEPLLQEI